MNSLYIRVYLGTLPADASIFGWYEEAKSFFTQNGGIGMHDTFKEIIKAWGMTILKEKGLPGA